MIFYALASSEIIWNNVFYKRIPSSFRKEFLDFSALREGFECTKNYTAPQFDVRKQTAAKSHSNASMVIRWKKSLLFQSVQTKLHLWLTFNFVKFAESNKILRLGWPL